MNREEMMWFLNVIPYSSQVLHQCMFGVTNYNCMSVSLKLIEKWGRKWLQLVQVTESEVQVSGHAWRGTMG